MRSVRSLSLPDLLTAWLVGSLANYFLLGFLDSFYPALWQLILWGIFWQTTLLVLLYYLVSSVRRRFRFRQHWLPALLLLAASFFTLAVVWLVAQFPGWFDPAFFTLEARALPWFASLAALSPVWSAALLLLAVRRGLARAWPSSRSFESLVANLPGLFLSFAFLAAYLTLALTYSVLLRDPSRNFDDNFYDADPTSWMNRFAAPAGSLIEMRPVHPFAFLIFRPLTWLVGSLLNGDKFHAAILLNAAAGALCVFLAWLFVRRWSNTAYALIVASLLGLSASHLVLSTFLETYMFSAAALIGFTLLLSLPERNLKALIPAGLVIFGITITNFVQTCILFLFTDFKPLKVAKYVLAVLVLALGLAWLQFALYPTSQPFYSRSQMAAEGRYSSDVSRPDRLYERGAVLARTIGLFSVVGPRPLALTHEIDCNFPCFKVYKPRYGRDLITSYAGFGSWLARLWFGVLLLASGLFVWKLYRSPRGSALQLALLACLLFNFVLHVLYGDDPMLYSPDWTYALVFFVALSLKDFAGRTWFQAAGLVFLAALMVNNWNFLRLMLVDVAPYL